MRKIIFLIGIMAVLSCCLAGTAAAAPSLSFDPATVSLAPGGTTDVRVKLSEAPQGLAGYKLTVGYPSSLVTVVGAAFPSWASSMNMKTPVKTGYLISAVDIGKQVQNGSSDILLGTITLKGVSGGTAMLTMSDIQMNDDTDAVITPSAGTMRVTVEGTPVTTTATTTTSIPAATTTAATTPTTATITTTAATTMATATTSAQVTGSTTPVPTTAAVTQATVAPAATLTVPAIIMAPPALAGSPACGFTADKVAGYAPMEVHFRDLSSGDAISGWEWSFGDGGSSLAQNPSYTYATPGTFTVSLTATNDIGSTSSTRTGFIRVLGPHEPMPTVTQAAPPAPVTTPEPARTLPVWTPPQTTAVPTKKAPQPPLLAVTALATAAAFSLVLAKKKF